MAFVNKIKACISCSKISIEQISGIYDADTNPEGWGSPNLAREDVSECILEIKYKTEVNQFDVTENISESTTWNIDLEEYPISLDGVYTITLTIEDGDGNKYIDSVKLTSECNVECCVAKLSLKVAEECNCDTLNMENFSKAEQILSTLKYVGKNLGEKEYYKQLKKLETICSSNGCGCGC
jgi:hypothetical protein